MNFFEPAYLENGYIHEKYFPELTETHSSLALSPKLSKPICFMLYQFDLKRIFWVVNMNEICQNWTLYNLLPKFVSALESMFVNSGNSSLLTLLHFFPFYIYIFISFLISGKE